jgi:hypothetical protein
MLTGNENDGNRKGDREREWGGVMRRKVMRCVGYGVIRT